MWDISHVQSACYFNSLVLLACSHGLAYITYSEPGSVLRVLPIYYTGKEKETLQTPVRIISDESEPSFSHSPIISPSPSSASINSHQSRSHNPNCRHLLRQGNKPRTKIPNLSFNPLQSPYLHSISHIKWAPAFLIGWKRSISEP